MFWRRLVQTSLETTTKISNYASGEGASITLQGSSAGGNGLINNDFIDILKKIINGYNYFTDNWNYILLHNFHNVKNNIQDIYKSYYTHITII